MTRVAVTCYGIIPLKRTLDGWEVFLVQQKHGKHWGFPKGHPNEGEEPKQTAERELYEETGLEVRQFLDHTLTNRYSFESEGKSVDKTVHFYLAEVTTEPILDASEIDAGLWMPVNKIFNYISFPEDKPLFESLITSLSK